MSRDPTLAQPVAGAPDYLRAEIAYAASHEGARHLDDILTRRTRISIEIEHYRKRLDAELESQQMPDHETADAARLGAADVVPLS